MFDLIVRVIVLGLAAVLGLVGIPYIGSALSGGAAKGNAAAIASQAQQIVGAYKMFVADRGSNPANVAALVTYNYLTAAPLPPSQVSGAWAFDTSSTPPVVALTLGANTKNICKYLHENTNGSGTWAANTVSDNSAALVDLATGRVSTCVGDDAAAFYVMRLD